VEEIRQSLYVDDLLSGGETMEQASQWKEAATAILEDATFKLHKWASNDSDLEDKSDMNIDHKEQTAAKMNLGVAPHESKILGLPWNKWDDTLSIQMANNASKKPTKRETLRQLAQLAKIYYSLGITSPITLQGKIVYRDICDAKLPWDFELNGTPTLDSTVALYWIKGAGEYRQFIANRVAKKQAHSDIKWHHVPTKENPANLGSRGGQLTELWLHRPACVSVQMANNASKKPTKRETLRQLAKIYDSLGIASPITLQGKIVYRDICDAKLPWDFELNGTLKPVVLVGTVPRPIAPYREPITDIHLHKRAGSLYLSICTDQTKFRRHPDLGGSKVTLSQEGSHHTTSGIASWPYGSQSHHQCYQGNW
jgi:hypothetical protein